MNATKACAVCGRRIYPQRCSVPGKHKHAGRGLCIPCYGVKYRTGELAGYRRTIRPCGEVAEEWAFLRELGYSDRDIAARLGLKVESLERALARAGVAA